MANIQAFRGLRYDLSKVGSLSDVVAPPYDVISQDLQDRLYAAHPNNVVRLILNRGDDLAPGETIYDSAAKFFSKWRRDGILREENQAAVYVYHQIFSFEGQEFTRKGFMARVRIEPFGEGSIYPHEETHSKAKEDRFKLNTACQANLSQIFGIYPDTENEIQRILENAIRDKTPLEAVDHLGVVHRMWLVTDAGPIAKAAKLMGTKPVYIADGHHRYETATNIRNGYQEKFNVGPDHPSNYVLMMCVSMFDPGMVILPTHRLFRGVAPTGSSELVAKISKCFQCEAAGTGAHAARPIWQKISAENSQRTMAFYCHADDTWILARLNEQGKSRMREITRQQSDEWRSLGVAILHNLVISDLLGLANLPSPNYVHSIEEVIQGIRLGDTSARDATGQQGSGKPFELSCLVMPATVEHVKQVSENGERMPAKSTYFYPKLLSGLVINPLN